MGKTIDKEESLKVMANYFSHLYENNFEKLDEMDHFLGKYSLWKLSPEQKVNLVRSICIGEIEKMIKNDSTKM